MIEEQIEHEYVSLLREVARRHDVEVEFDFSANDHTEEGVFKVGIIMRNARLRRINNLTWALLAAVAAASVTALLTQNFAAAIAMWVGIGVHCWVQRNTTKVAPPFNSERIKAEFMREWTRKYPDMRML